MIFSLPDLTTSIRRIVFSAMAGLACLMLPGFTVAQSEWLTLVGNESQPSEEFKDMVQVNPGSINDTSGLRVMQIRASRAETRLSWDGVPYRSFEATVEFDCEKKTARYASLNYFMEPVWRGTSHKTSTYTREQFRPMAFRSMVPNPAARIIRAACESKAVLSN